MSAHTGIVIVTYNGMEWIDRCLGSVVDRDRQKVYVVDNGSVDGTPGYIRTHFPDVHLTIPGSNLGFGKANNLGIAEAINHGADSVFLLNQDAWVGDGTIAKLVAVLKRHPEFGVVSPLHLNGAGDAPDQQFEQYCSASGLDFAAMQDVLDSEVRILPIDFVNAAGWLVSGNCLRRVGGFHPAFFMYGEDTEYVDRLRLLGFQLGICPQATLFHDRARRAERDKNESEVYFFGVRATIALSGNRFRRALTSGAQTMNDSRVDQIGNNHTSESDSGIINPHSGKYKVSLYTTKRIIDELYKPFLLNILRSPIRSIKILLRKLGILYRVRKNVKGVPVTLEEYRFLSITPSEDHSNHTKI